MAMVKARRRWIWMVAASVAATIAATIGYVAVGDAQTKPRCVAHADAVRQGYSYCGTDQYPR